MKKKRYSAGGFDLADGGMLYINLAYGCLKQIGFNMRPEIALFEIGKA